LKIHAQQFVPGVSQDVCKTLINKGISATDRLSFCDADGGLLGQGAELDLAFSDLLCRLLAPELVDHEDAQDRCAERIDGEDGKKDVPGDIKSRVPGQRECARQHDDVDGIAEYQQIAPGQFCQGPFQRMAPGEADDAGGDDDGYAHDRRSSALDDAKCDGGGHHQQSRDEPEKQTADADEYRASVEDDTGHVDPGRQHDGGDDNAQS
jgi:hypothetical protein